MAKIHAYIITITVLILLFNFGGLISNTGTSYVLGQMGLREPQNFDDTSFYATLIAITTISLAGVSIGLIYGRSADMILLASVVSIAAYTVLIGWDLIVLFNTLRQVNTFLATMVTGPVLILFFLSVAEWVRGMQ
jgi:hypothetical protein